MTQTNEKSPPQSMRVTVTCGVGAIERVRLSGGA
jgi:hypothetical protein